MKRQEQWDMKVKQMLKYLKVNPDHSISTGIRNRLGVHENWLSSIEDVDISKISFLKKPRR